MSDGGGSGAFGVHDADFDSLYRGGPLAEGVSFRGVPWDIGQAQPCVMEFERAGRFLDEVLDVGCGLGENSIYLADFGHRVTGIDASPAAIERARRRAGRRGVDVEFAVADATSLYGYEGRFGSVLDSACYHCLDEAERRAYTAALHRATKPGALLNLFCFADARAPVPVSMGVSEENLRTTLDAMGWRITALTQVPYLVTTDVREFAAETGQEIDLPPDDTGHLRMPVWAVQAERAA